MRIPIEWLREYVDIDLAPEALAELLTGLGTEIEEILPAPDGLGGVVLVAELTPNRGDLLSLCGVARELAAATGAALRLPDPKLARQAGLATADRCRVTIADPDLCPRYAAQLVTGVTNGPSPQWLQDRLIACGQRPLNVVVDVTNYVMFELGQPLHAFDADLLGETIAVRRARPAEVVVTLDNVKRTLDDDVLLITDGSEAVALAGVMGAGNTAVSATTTNVLLEAAHFQPGNIRRTAMRLQLQSESSYRFARTVDPNLPPLALARAAQLLAELAGGQVAAGLVDEVPGASEPLRLRLRPDRCNRFLGTTIPVEVMTGYLESLGLGTACDGEHLAVIVPTRRPDITREVDLIEEVARLHGYNNIPMTPPPAAKQIGRLSERQRLESRVREVLLAGGLQEVQTFSLTNDEALAKARLTPEGLRPIRVDNALSSEYSVLRWSMIPSTLDVLQRNAAVQLEQIRVFELGRIYRDLRPEATDAAAQAASRTATGHTATALPVPCAEQRTLAGAVTGRWLTSEWNLAADSLAADFFEVKGILELVCGELAVDGVVYEPHQAEVFTPGRAAQLVHDGQVIGVLGEVAAAVRDAYDLRQEVVLFELNLDHLLDRAAPAVRYRPLPRQPAALRDLALVVPDEVPAARVQEVLQQTGGERLESVALFDVYRGKGLPAGARSLAYRLSFRDHERTMTDDEVDGLIQAILDAARSELRAELRA